MTAPWTLSNLMSSHRPGPWLENALCAQVGAVDFFPGRSESAEPAKKICRMCEVVNECLLYAITSPTPLQGIWGGKSTNERKELRRTAGIRDEEWIEDFHGSERGEKIHRRRGEQPCRPCMDAANAAARERVRRREVCPR